MAKFTYTLQRSVSEDTGPRLQYYNVSIILSAVRHKADKGQMPAK